MKGCSSTDGNLNKEKNDFTFSNREKAIKDETKGMGKMTLFRTLVMREAGTAADRHTNAVHLLEHKLVPLCSLTNYTC